MSNQNQRKNPHSKSSKNPRPQKSQKPQGQQKAASKGDEVPRSYRIIAGQHAIDEAIKIQGRKLKGLWLKQGWESSNELRELNSVALKLGLSIEVKSEVTLDRYCATHQGALVFADGRPRIDYEKLESLEQSTILILDGLEDPHNLGAILRTSWLVGCQGALTPEERAVGLTSTVHKVACGGVEHVPVEELTSFTNTVEKLKQQGFWVFGLSPRGKKSIFELQIPEKVVWAIGSEDKGLRTTTEKLCDELVYIPQQTEAASYNASVATAMALTETLRQRQNSKKGHKS